MFGKRKDIILSESTLVILESAYAVIEHVTCGSAKKFRMATIKFQDREDKETQMVAVHGLVELGGSKHLKYLFEARIHLLFKKSGYGDWILDPNSVVNVVHNDLQISLVVGNDGSFSYLSPVQIEFHEELKRRWRFTS